MCEVVEIERVGNDAFKLFIYIHDTVSNIVSRFRYAKAIIATYVHRSVVICGFD